MSAADSPAARSIILAPPPAHDSMADLEMWRSAKRRRISWGEDVGDNESEQRRVTSRRRSDALAPSTRQTVPHPDPASAIAIDTSSRHASQAVAPFLADHIPYHAHAPFYDKPQKQVMEPNTQRDPNSKYCYRHRMDLKCRRQANEPSMDQLQEDLESLPPNDQQGIAHVWSLFSAAPAKQRQLMLQGILTQCCFPQLSFLAARTRELLKIDFLVTLPTELSLKILCYLDTTSLTKAAQVSKSWRRLADDDVVWHRMCEQHIDRKCTRCGWGLPLLEKKRLMDSKKEIEQRFASLASKPVAAQYKEATPEVEMPDSETPPSTSLTRPWKDVYRDRFRVGCNWKHGRFSIKNFRHNSSMGVMALQYDDKMLASGSYDGTIKLWNIKTGELINTLKGHRSGIRCLHFDEKILVTGSLDHTLRIWDWRTGKCVRQLVGHEGGVISCHMVGKIIVSGSTDGTVRVWNFHDKTTSVLRGHTDWVNSVRLDVPSRTLFSASDDLTVRLWDLDTKQTIRIFEGHVGQVQQVVPLPREFEFDEEPCDDQHSDGIVSHAGTPAPEGPDDGESVSSTCREALPLFEPSAERAGPPHYMLTGALDSMIRLWDVRSGKILRTFFGHVEGVWALAADTLRIVSGAQDRTVKVWDAKTGKCERTFTGHSGPVTCIDLGDSSMCTGSEDGEVRLYSFAAS